MDVSSKVSYLEKTPKQINKLLINEHKTIEVGATRLQNNTMKITALKTYLVPPRWLFLKIQTDEGLTGWGEPVLEGHAETLATKIEEFADFLIGRNPLHIEDIWQSLYRNGCYRGGPVLMSAISGIDMALWDIKGRYLDAPVYSLLGGPVRDKIKTYCWIGGDRPENLVDQALELKVAGF